MTTQAIVMMVAVCGVVWGGFVVLLVRAIRREAQKQRDERNGTG